jgi:RecJ-like exonuclease
MLYKADFGQLDALTAELQKTYGQIQQEMDEWQRMSGATEADWLDRAGGAFAEVSNAAKQFAAVHQAVINALRDGVVTANEEMQVALASAHSRVSAVTIQ